MHVKDYFFSNEIPDFRKCNPKIELIFVEVNSQIDEIIIRKICRPPKGNFNYFIETLTSILHEISRSFMDHKLILMGDFNLNLFKICSDSRVMNYCIQLVTYGLFPAIFRAAWVANTKASLIDNTWTSNSKTILWSCIILCDISDHYPTFCSISLNGSAYNRPQVLTYKK